MLNAIKERPNSKLALVLSLLSEHFLSPLQQLPVHQ